MESNFQIEIDTHNKKKQVISKEEEKDSAVAVDEYKLMQGLYKCRERIEVSL